MYPVAFVDAIALIVDRGYVGGRLDRAEWDRFRSDAFAAYDTTVGHLLQGVVAGQLSESGIYVRRQAIGQPTVPM
jgi:hypothetical protein